ncbi:MAG: clostripain-related cysteine peptidase [Candidatus Stygibacter australis]|nr:clostripain-related cysteine peptidase [Candidatus Stygibacter australis]
MSKLNVLYFGGNHCGVLSTIRKVLGGAWIFCLSALFLSSCTVKTPPHKAVTFMVYMAADNSLSEFALTDIDEMERAHFNNSEANVIVQADQAVYAENPYCRRWEIVADSLYDDQVSSPLIDELGEIDSGDWHSLAAFYNWCVDNYPAERYVLSIWSHGNDWYSYATNPNKFCVDSQSNSFISITEGELELAFRAFDEYPDLVILDACHMQSIEVLSEISPWCNYISGSTDLIPDSGYPYDEIITAVCRALNYDYSAIPDIYVNSYKPGGSQNPTGMLNQAVCASLIETEVFNDEILNSVAEFVVYCLDHPEVFSDLMSARAGCFEYNDLEIDVDLLEFCWKLTDLTNDPELAELAAKLNEELITANNFYNYPAAYAGNLLITFPEISDSETWMNLRNDFYKLNFNQLTNWGELINKIVVPADRELVLH